MIRSNEFHTYFRVNSVFWDPNIYGRYLALVIVVAMAALLWARERRDARALDRADRRPLGRPGADLLAVELRRPARRPGGPGGAALEPALDARGGRRGARHRRSLVSSSPAALRRSALDRFNIDTSGRANLVSGGIHLFAQRPLWGYGSGSFPRAYREHVATHKVPVSVSHTEPITVAAEQGLIGLARLRALIVTALWTMGVRLFVRSAGGADDGGVEAAPPAAPPSSAPGPAAGAVLAAFVALLVHTMAYAGFYEDPITWVLLAVGASLAAARGPRLAHRLQPVSGYLRRLATTGAAYTAASIVSKLIAVALLPLYTRYLTPADYGAAEVMFAAVVSASIVVRLRHDRGAAALLLQGRRGPRSVVATSFAALFWLATAAALVALPFAGPISEALLDRPRRRDLARIAIGGLWVLTMFEYLLTLFRLEERARAFFVTTILSVLRRSALTVVLVVGAGEGARGLLLGSYASGAAFVARR